MSGHSAPALGRRSFIAGSASLGLATALPGGAAAVAREIGEFRLVAAPGQVPLVGVPYPETQVWTYNG